MKEAVLRVKHGDGSETSKVSVKLTSENLIVTYLEDLSHPSPIPSTAIDSPLSSVNKESFSGQTTASLSSTDSSIRSVPITSKPELLPPVSQPKLAGAASENKEKPIMPANENSNPERVVTIKRQPGGGLGISVKGGAEHGIPVLISRVFRGQAADQTHLLHPGDAIIAVNEKRVDEMMHDDVVAELRSCGPQVALTVRAYDGANHVLRTATSSATPSKSSVSSDQPLSPSDDRRASGDSPHPQPPSVSRDYFTPVEMHPPPATPSAPEHPQTPTKPNLNQSTHINSTVASQWRSDVTVPLALARLERHVEGTDRVRDDCFEVIASDGNRSGLITCSGQSELDDWLQAVSAAIHRATMDQAAEAVKSDDAQEIIQYMGWVGERPGIPGQLKPQWNARFLAIRGGKLLIFDHAPQTIDDWSRCSRVHVLHESLCRSHVLTRQLLDNRQHCFSVQHSSQPPIYCSMQTRDELVRWEESVQKATHEAVYKLQTQSYQCTTTDGKPCEFVIHFNHGFKMIDSSSQNSLWEYKFSQLKGSADDGKSLITFSFQNRTTNQLESQRFSCDRAYPLLFCVHSFLAAKLSLVDPTFLEKINARARQTPDSTIVSPGLANGDPSTRNHYNESVSPMSTE
uniref:Gamma-1-syntrophin-like n=1 Tax=Phallusia mammillata TaxID=59560 RepID=A0A6F9DTW1_9ASCI|nr:gamma-1-syntrophin-like [Phallusia mammillata]